MPNHTFKPMFANAYNQNTHMLLFMTWLLPLVAPVLAVWVRTIQTAGYKTPFNGDHNVLKVVPVLMLVDLLGRGRPLDMTCVFFLLVLILSFLNRSVSIGRGGDFQYVGDGQG